MQVVPLAAAGVERFLRPEKGDFIGRSAVMEAAAKPQRVSR
jgi:glycine cleavage system aminomethyltransferase T